MLFFFKKKTAYEMRISDWSSDVCSSDLVRRVGSMVGARFMACAVGKSDYAAGASGDGFVDHTAVQPGRAERVGSGRGEHAPGGVDGLGRWREGGVDMRDLPGEIGRAHV